VEVFLTLVLWSSPSRWERGWLQFIQLATPRLVAIAVRMAITVCSTNFQVSSFFIVLFG
jgi:hypothetical protein